MKRIRAAFFSACVFSGAGACARPVPTVAVAVVADPADPTASPPLPPPPAPGWPYWQAVPAELKVEGSAPKRPLQEGAFARIDGAEARWLAAPVAVRDGVLEDGFAVWTRGEHRTRFGEFYAALSHEQVPALLTLDALFFLAHLARDRAFADVEASVLAPSLDRLLRRLDARLAAEQQGAPTDLLSGYRVARGVVAVALALETGSVTAPADLAAQVSAEVALALSHAGIAKSPLLDTPIDYTVFAARGAIEEGDSRAGTFRAAVWLAYAPLAMVAGTEQSTSPADVGTARVETRAALLLTRLVQADVDAEAAQAWNTIARVAELAVGHPADLAPAGLFNIARGSGLDLHDATAIADIVRLDHARHAVGHARPGASFRLVSEGSAPDAAVLQALVAPLVARRMMPSALDVGAWLGSVPARLALRDAGLDAYAGYEEALERQYTARPALTERHASFYLTALDDIAVYVAPSAADGTFAPASGDAWKRHKLEAALGAWTELRHDSQPYSRIVVLSANPPMAPGIEAALVLVEPHPEAIARLLALVRHIARGFTSLSALPLDAPSRALLAEVDDILATALKGAIDAAADRSPSPALATALGQLPARMAAIEARVAGSGADQTALVTDVHTSEDAGRVLEEATGELDDLYAVVRDPGRGRFVLAIGAALAHHELERPSTERLTDTAWRVGLASAAANGHGHAAAPRRDPFTSAFVRK